jgi:hypothetical protein
LRCDSRRNLSHARRVGAVQFNHKRLIIYLGTPLLHKLKRIDLSSKQPFQMESL